MVRLFASVMLGCALLAPVQSASAQDAVGGAVLGGVLGGIVGGAASGRAGGAVAGALIGGATGAIIGSDAERRRGGFYWWHGECYQRVREGYMRVHPRNCR